MSLLPFFAQERPESCVPACIRMVLAFHGIVCTEAEISQCCESEPEGTLPSAAVRCLQKFGFNATSLRLYDGIESLRLHSLNAHIIAFVNLTPLMGIGVLHAVILETLHSEEGTLTIIDPAFPPTGRRLWSVGLFEIGWQLARNQVILISH